jgi:phage baseplate assembly protein W
VTDLPPPTGVPGIESDFRGVGWQWPLALEPDGSIALAEYDESIRQSILLILGTAPGERVMRPEFGCGIHDLVFSPLLSATASLVAFEVREALIQWEPRIKLLDVRAVAAPDDPEGSKLLVTIEYRVRLTDSVFNLVYPFYVQRAA